MTLKGTPLMSEDYRCWVHVLNRCEPQWTNRDRRTWLESCLTQDQRDQLLMRWLMIFRKQRVRRLVWVQSRSGDNRHVLYFVRIVHSLIAEDSDWPLTHADEIVYQLMEADESNADRVTETA